MILILPARRRLRLKRAVEIQDDFVQETAEVRPKKPKTGSLENGIVLKVLPDYGEVSYFLSCSVAQVLH